MLSVQIIDGTPHTKPQTMPMMRSGKRCARRMASRSGLLACSASASKPITLAVSQPQINGGSTSASPGTSQNGSVMTTITIAAIVHPSDASAPSHHDPPWRRSSDGNLRRATSPTTDGVTHRPTSTSVNATTTGMLSAITISDAMPVRKPAPSMDEIHSSIELTSSQWFSVARTEATAGSQNTYPRAQRDDPRHHQRQQRQEQHLRVQAIGDSAPERAEQQFHRA